MNTTEKNSGAIAYSRVSTHRQADSGVGMAAQRDALAAGARMHGLEIVAWCEDNGRSGASMARRPGLQDALAAIRSGEAGALICAKVDRLGRSAAEVLTLGEAAQHEGWRLIVLDAGLDTSTPAGEMVLTALAMAARFEHRRISERQVEKFTILRKQGRPRGRAAVPTEVADRIIAMREAGLSLRAIVDVLVSENIPTAQGGTWAAASVRSAIITRQRELAALAG